MICHYISNLLFFFHDSTQLREEERDLCCHYERKSKFKRKCNLVSYHFLLLFSSELTFL